MKKTLIAAAVAAVVAAPAYAEVKIGGAVEFQQIKVDGAGWDGSEDNFIKFSSSEDLGNGMTAFADITMTANSTTAGTKDTKIGVKGGFGTVMFGRFEDFSEGVVMSQFTLEGDGSAGGGAVETGADGEIMADRADNGVAYVSPTVNGFHFAVGGFTGVNSGSAAFDATDILLAYDNGPLSIKASQENWAQAAQTNADHDEYVNQIITASYTMGDLKATVGRKKTTYDVSGVETDSTDMLYRVDYKMGNNAISIAMNDGENYTTGTSNNDSDVTAVELTHNFSKSTKAYLTHVNKDGTNVDSLSVGLKHKF
jgi:hypothetical protein